MVCVELFEDSVEFKCNGENYCMYLYNIIDYIQQNNLSDFVGDIGDIVDLLDALLDIGDINAVIMICKSLYDSDLESDYYLIDFYDYNINTFNNLVELNDIYDIGDIVEYIIKNEWIQEYAELIE